MISQTRCLKIKKKPPKNHLKIFFKITPPPLKTTIIYWMILDSVQAMMHFTIGTVILEKNYFKLSMYFHYSAIFFLWFIFNFYDNKKGIVRSRKHYGRFSRWWICSLPDFPLDAQALSKENATLAIKVFKELAWCHKNCRWSTLSRYHLRW